MSASCSIASEKGEPSRMCHIFIFVLLVANFFLHFLLLVSFFFSISCVVNNWACYDVIEEWDSHRNQNWPYHKKYILLLLFLMLEDSWCANVMSLHMKLTLKKLTIINLELSAMFLEKWAVHCFIWHCLKYLINTLSMFLLVLDTSIDVHSHLICNVMTQHLTLIPRY